MDLVNADAAPSDPARLEREGRRVADRLSTMSLVRLAAPMADGRSRAGLALTAAQELADIAACLAGQPRRQVPDLPAHAVGDVITVMVNDLLRLAPAGTDCQAAVEVLVRLRQQL